MDYLAEVTLSDGVVNTFIGLFLMQFVAGFGWGINITYKVRELFMRDDVQKARIDSLEKTLQKLEASMESQTVALTEVKTHQGHSATALSDVKTMMQELIHSIREIREVRPK